jgi:plastocyanin
MLIPVKFTVKVGTTVKLCGRECSGSNVEISESPRTEAPDAGELSARFDKPGIYHFVCSSMNPKMLLTIVVE